MTDDEWSQTRGWRLVALHVAPRAAIVFVVAIVATIGFVLAVGALETDRIHWGLPVVTGVAVGWLAGKREKGKEKGTGYFSAFLGGRGGRSPRQKPAPQKSSLSPFPLFPLAKDLASHRGYQHWHIELDDDVVRWLDMHPSASTLDFEAFLKQRYAQPDLLQRFPDGMTGG